jgi:hypothetical protein
MDPQGLGCSAVRILVEGNRVTSEANGTTGQTSIPLRHWQVANPLWPHDVTV